MNAWDGTHQRNVHQAILSSSLLWPLLKSGRGAYVVATQLPLVHVQGLQVDLSLICAPYMDLIAF